jgi:hypothetical protein
MENEIKCVLRIKRRLAGDAGPPTTLSEGELAFNEVDGTLYIGVGSTTTTSTSSTSGV